jgi:hypothetical protein
VKSPKRFRAELRERLLELHWRQWCALGVVAQVEPEQQWMVDLEALVASTARLGQEDARLHKLAGEWLGMNRGWVSNSRLSRIEQAFAASSPADAQAVLVPAEPASRGAKVTRPVVTRPALLQLQLRALFGMDVRADVFGYLLFNKSGNSSSIARAVYVHQRRVYDVLERWDAAGIVRRASGGYVLATDAVPSVMARARRVTGWLNWTATYIVLSRMWMLARDAATDDRYVWSSLFRDVGREVESAASAVGIDVPRPEPYPGGAYFEPFAGAIISWLGRLLG